jgi:cytochrome c556
MSFGKLLKSIAGSAIVLGLGVNLAYAAADDAIKARQACMKANGGMMGVMVPIVKGEKPFDAAAVKAAMDASGAACADWANFWGADTQQGETLATRAKPEIWTDPAGFEAAGKAFGAALGPVAAATDDASFKAAFGALGAACNGCHEKFQKPKE